MNVVTSNLMLMKNVLNGFVLILIFFCSCVDNNNTSDGEEQMIQSGLMEYSFEYDGLTRSYLLYIPSSYNSESECPLVYNFHGFGGQINSYISYADLRSEAESANFILVYPQGSNLNGDPHWNAAPVGGDNKSNTDDFGFIEALNSHLVSNYSIDPSKIFACGYSNGGMMAYGLACYKQQIFSAVASISGVMLDTDCVSSIPVSILSIHGTADFVLPYNGNEYYSAVQETLAYWNQTNQTDEEATREFIVRNHPN